VRTLLERSFSSVRQVDLLLLLRETHRQRDWSAGELETALRTSATAVDGDLAALLQAQLVEVQHGPPTLWRYRSGPHDRTVDALAGCYRSHKTAVVRLASSGGGGSLDAFADAFRRPPKEPSDG
jgi:hypothetical protein